MNNLLVHENVYEDFTTTMTNDSMSSFEKAYYEAKRQLKNFDKGNC